MFLRVNYNWIRDVFQVTLCQNVPNPFFVDFSWIRDFGYVFIKYEYGLINYGYGMF